MNKSGQIEHTLTHTQTERGQTGDCGHFFVFWNRNPPLKYTVFVYILRNSSCAFSRWKIKWLTLTGRFDAMINLVPKVGQNLLKTNIFSQYYVEELLLKQVYKMRIFNQAKSFIVGVINDFAGLKIDHTRNKNKSSNAKGNLDYDNCYLIKIYGVLCIWSSDFNLWKYKKLLFTR